MINNASRDTLVTSYGPAATNGQAKAGIYYNYCAATVGTYCYDDTSGTGNAIYDICPANWRLPTGGQDSGEFLTLQNEYDTTMVATDSDSLQYNLSVSMSGSFVNNSGSGQDSYVYYWSSTHQGHYGVYAPSFLSNYVMSNTTTDRVFGHSIRCIVDT